MGIDGDSINIVFVVIILSFIFYLNISGLSWLRSNPVKEVFRKIRYPVLNQYELIYCIKLYRYCTVRSNVLNVYDVISPKAPI